MLRRSLEWSLKLGWVVPGLSFRETLGRIGSREGNLRCQPLTHTRESPRYLEGMGLERD